MPWLAELDRLPGFATEEDGPAERYELIRRTNHQHPDHDTAEWPPKTASRK
jgi:hypothetical protein